MSPALSLLAQATSEKVTTTYRFSRLQEIDDQRWQYALLAVICVAVIALVVWMYRRDTVELRRPVAWLLVTLRIGALLVALFFYLGLEKRTEKEVVHNSRVLMLVDTSQSMARHDDQTSGVPATPSRIDLVVAALQEGPLLKDLRRTHDVHVVGFNRNANRLASLKKLDINAKSMTTDTQEDDDAASDIDAENGLPADKPPSDEIDWQQALLPRGEQTALGNAIKQLIDEEQANPVSAVVVVTDGAQNAGLEPATAIEAAIDAEVPIYTVGLGSDRRPVNVRVSDVVAPQRAYPGDSFTVTGYLQAQGLAGRTVTVELYSKDAADKQGSGLLEDSQRVTLSPDGEVLPVKFELRSEEATRQTFRFQVTAPQDDRNVADNSQEFDIEIVDRETRVLLFASGATREYRFLRDQLRRDKSMVVDVLLQSARPGISQDANEILDDFPITKEEMYQYDTIVAFDPDWEGLSSAQIDLLETWIAEEAGGMIAIAGPIHTSSWASSDAMSKIRNLYPVQFQRRLSVLDDSEFGSKDPWPLAFTREGTEAKFLWLDDDAVQSQGAWDLFEGVYGFYSVKGAKPGATVHARFSDPESGLGDELPVYFAEHLYGAGRVFYMGSGEMWRLRGEDPAFFEQLYTKLIRQVSQGRLLRGSTRGVLLVERDRYQLGDTVAVRAQLSDANHEPITIPTVSMQVIRPDTTTQTVTLAADANRPGQYNGQFTVLQERGYQLLLPVPETIDEQLSKRIQVGGLLDLEQKNPQRNDALLSEIATSTGGLYYVGFEAVSGSGGTPPLVGQLRDVRETTILAGSPDKAFEKLQMQWILGLICGALCLEWLIRRLSKLA